uniref:Uncharacterized protein n=1 Tax=Podoviridae sp. ctZih56 TaxID=2827741 RepID=A0A8S5SGE1_9CAUD|nr:MAG TPA: hypothetical protein [Podoviridae sp. ctZih56]
MDRLTIPDVKVDSHTTRRTMIDAEAVKERAMEIYWKLKKYEDTGLTPAEVLSMSAEWCAMMSVLNSIGSYDRLLELAEADKEGRVAVLPCRVGDTVYFVSKRYKCINELTINSVESIVLLGKKWGKCVFVSREEAEKALEEAKRNG